MHLGLLNPQQTAGYVFTSEPRKKPSYFPLYWLVNRDPYFIVYFDPYITGQYFIPYIAQPSKVFFIAQ